MREFPADFSPRFLIFASKRGDRGERSPDIFFLETDIFFRTRIKLIQVENKNFYFGGYQSDYSGIKE